MARSKAALGDGQTTALILNRGIEQRGPQGVNGTHTRPRPSTRQSARPHVKRIDNGLEGDARRSTSEIGKRASNMKVGYAVDQIPRLLK